MFLFFLPVVFMIFFSLLTVLLKNRVRSFSIWNFWVTWTQFPSLMLCLTGSVTSHTTNKWFDLSHSTTKQHSKVKVDDGKKKLLKSLGWIHLGLLWLLFQFEVLCFLSLLEDLKTWRITKQRKFFHQYTFQRISSIIIPLHDIYVLQGSDFLIKIYPT